MWNIRYAKEKKEVFKNPILVDGLLDYGNIGKIAVDYIIKLLKAEKFCELYPSSIPNLIFINDENLIELPMIEMFCKKMEDKTLFFLTGDTHLLDDETSYEFCDTILEVVQEFKAQEIITIGSITLQQPPKNPKVYCTGNKKENVELYSSYGVNTDLHGVSSIIGISGLLTGLAGRRKIPSVSLLAETSEDSPSIESVYSIIEILNKRLNLELDPKEFSKEIEILKKIKPEQDKKDPDVSYIG